MMVEPSATAVSNGRPGQAKGRMVLLSAWSGLKPAGRSVAEAGSSKDRHF